MLTLTVCHKGETAKGRSLEIGDVCDYLGHVLGGMVKIRIEEKEDIAHPGCFKELN